MEQAPSRLPGSVRILCEAAPEFGVSAEVCLEGVGLTVFDLHDTSTRITVEQEMMAIQNFLREVPYRPGLGIELGRRIKPEVLGIWGYALLTSPNMRASFNTARDYAQLSFIIAPMDLVEEEDHALVTFDISAVPEGLRQFVLERQLTVLFNFGVASLPGNRPLASVFRTTEFDASFAQILEDMSGIRVEPSNHQNAVLIPSEMLDVPFPKHDPEVLANCLRQCDGLLGKVAPVGWSARVQEVILSDLGNQPTIGSVARALNTSERTLARRLAEEDTNFRAILGRIRLSVAHELLTTTNLSVSKVAWRAGYSEPSSFVRAYVKEHGYTPGKAARNRSNAAD